MLATACGEGEVIHFGNLPQPATLVGDHDHGGLVAAGVTVQGGSHGDQELAELREAVQHRVADDGLLGVGEGPGEGRTVAHIVALLIPGDGQEADAHLRVDLAGSVSGWTRSTLSAWAAPASTRDRTAVTTSEDACAKRRGGLFHVVLPPSTSGSTPYYIFTLPIGRAASS